MSSNIESHLVENRVFKPKKDFSKKAHISSLEQYRELYRKSIKNPEKFWAEQAAENLTWQKKWKTVLEWKEPFAKWFVGGKLNVSENCLDRHLAGATRNKAALIWEGEPGEKVTLTYQQLHREVSKFANVLKRFLRISREIHRIAAGFQGGCQALSEGGVVVHKQNANDRWQGCHLHDSPLAV